MISEYNEQVSKLDLLTTCKLLYVNHMVLGWQNKKQNEMKQTNCAPFHDVVLSLLACRNKQPPSGLGTASPAYVEARQYAPVSSARRQVQVLIG